MIKSKPDNSYIFLLIGFIFLFFFNGKWILPIAAFAAPVFLIRFLRFQKPLKGFLILVIIFFFSNIFVWKGMIPISGIFYFFVAFMMGVFTSISFLIDKIYTQKIRGIISTLILPSVYVIIDFIVVSTNPSGSYGTLAHTQSSLPLIQIISITGIWGLTFYIMWTASIINWLWDNSFEKAGIEQVTLVYGLPFMFIILYGQIRVSTTTPDNTVRIASLNINKTELNDRIRMDSDSVRNRLNTNFLKNAEVAASSGAKIVFGTETAIKLNADREAEYINKARRIAEEKNIYLGLPMAVILNAEPHKAPENKIVWISPVGKVLFTYHKAKPTSSGEGDYGDGIIKYFNSPYGRIGSAICFDMDFVSLIKQAGKMDIDIMLVPGNDWREIAPYHTFVASFRAIEFGFNLVRAASNGLSASFNHKGQLISSLDYFKTNELTLYSDVPTKGHKTLYAMSGNYFIWICIIFFISIHVNFFRKAR